MFKPSEKNQIVINFFIGLLYSKNSILGRTSPPKATLVSLKEDSSPSLFANTVEYPRPLS